LEKVLFICTGNIFRSLSAEYALRLAAVDRQAISIASAGTAAEPKQIPLLVKQELTNRGADLAAHVPRRLTAELLNQATLPIAIAVDHQKFVKDQFALSIPLLNEMAYGDRSSIPDLWEVYPDWRERPAHIVEIYTRSTINHIFDCISLLLPKLGQEVGPVSR
jgi:protein-tyrosine phosphatase